MNGLPRMHDIYLSSLKKYDLHLPFQHRTDLTPSMKKHTSLEFICFTTSSIVSLKIFISEVTTSIPFPNHPQ